MKWYAIYTQSGREAKLRDAILKLIEDRGMQSSFGEIIVPEVEVEEKKSGKKRFVKRNLYPGYIFIQMDFTEDTLFLIKAVSMARKPIFIGERKRYGTQKGFVTPTIIPDAEIQKIRKMMEEGELSTVSTIMFEKGEEILIKDGPFAGFKATIDDVKEGKEKLDVLVNIFGRSTPVELNFSQVEKIED